MDMKNSEKTLDMIVNLCKNRGFIYPGSEIYGGLANSWDYGPLGVEFKNNVKKAWLKKFVQESPYNVGLDAAILMNPQTWVTTGHVASFSDPLLDCRACKSRHRADKLIADCEQDQGVDVDAMTFDEMDAFIASHPEVVCPVCGKHDFTPIRKFNLMFKTAIGVTEDSSSTCYLRPETAQGIFVNFANIQRTTRRKLPFGVCQVGKAFRNEITPGNFTFALASGRKTCACATTRPPSWPSTPAPPPTSSMPSPSPTGASCGALPTAPTTTWAAIRRLRARALSTLTPRPTSATSPM